MGCSSCGGARRSGPQVYKYLTRTQILERFNKFKEEHCSLFCEFVATCTIDTYRSCRKKQKAFEII